VVADNIIELALGQFVGEMEQPFRTEKRRGAFGRPAPVDELERARRRVGYLAFYRDRVDAIDVGVDG
jgi:hypothetical protein